MTFITPEAITPKAKHSSSPTKRRIATVAVAVMLVLCLTVTAYADDLRVTNSGANCIKYGEQTWYPVSNASSWYKYNINDNTVSARGGTHYLSDAQAEQYGIATGGSADSGTYKQKIITITKAKIKPGKKVKKSVAYKKAKKMSVKVNKNKAGFTKTQIARAKKINKGNGWIALSALDKYKRAGRAISLLNDNTLPTKGRERLTYNPSGWCNALVNVQGKNIWFYNRSHLIAFCLSGLNNEKRNLITGAAKMNNPTMLKIETAVVQYVEDTDNAVLYEVTPIYRSKEKVARGVQIRCKSIDLGVKDNKKIEKNVYLYNRNPGWNINYKTGNFKKAA
jgi:DNA-entry nuclease